MAVVIETLVFCDECQDNCCGDDRNETAYNIRRSRREHGGWIMRNGKDYCPACVEKLSLRKTK